MGINETSSLLSSWRRDLNRELRPPRFQSSKSLLSDLISARSFSDPAYKSARIRPDAFKKVRQEKIVKQRQPFSKQTGRRRTPRRAEIDRLLTPRSTLSHHPSMRFSTASLQRFSSSKGSICARDFYSNNVHRDYAIRHVIPFASGGPRFKTSHRSEIGGKSPLMRSVSSFLVKYPKLPSPAFAPPSHTKITNSSKRQNNVEELLFKSKEYEPERDNNHCFLH
jgi:hypothetical protein